MGKIIRIWRNGYIKRWNGKIDLNSFFKPRYDLNIASKEVHLESSYDNFQGSGALNLSVKGKDTIMVTGTFLPSPNDFVITNYNTNYKIT